QAAVVVTGSGFTPGEPITLTLGNTNLATHPSPLVASTAGAFSTTVTIPSLNASGTYTVTARGAQSLAAGLAPLKVVLPVVSRWYFAEGFTGQGPTTSFSETLHVLNTTTSPAAGTITYMLPKGVTTTVPITV